jgi:hypothetical protein
MPGSAIAVLEEEVPYHPLGNPTDGFCPPRRRSLGLGLEATPTLAEALAPRIARTAARRK